MNCYSTHTGIDTCKEDMTSQSLRQPQTCAKGQMSVISTQKVVNQPGTFFCTTHAFTNRNQIHRWQILEDLGPRDSIDMPFLTTQASADCFRSISRWNTIGLLIFPTSQECMIVYDHGVNKKVNRSHSPDFTMWGLPCTLKKGQSLALPHYNAYIYIYPRAWTNVASENILSWNRLKLHRSKMCSCPCTRGCWTNASMRGMIFA